MRHVLRDAVVQAQIDKTNEAIQLVIGLQGTQRLCDLAKNMAPQLRNENEPAGNSPRQEWGLEADVIQ